MTIQKRDPANNDVRYQIINRIAVYSLLNYLACMSFNSSHAIRPVQGLKLCKIKPLDHYQAIISNIVVQIH